MKNYIIHDTLEAFLKEGENLYYFGMTTNANINQSVNQEKLKAGIGNKTFAVIQSDKEVTFSITTGLHYNGTYEVQSGTKFTQRTASIHDIEVDDSGTVIATPKEVTGNVIDFKANTFSKNHEVQLHTLAYDVDKNVPVADIYYLFKKSLPDGALNETFENKNKTSEIKFTTQVDAEGNYGQCIIVPKDSVVPVKE